MEDFANRFGEVPIVFEVLWQSGEVARHLSPVRTNVIKVDSVGSATS